jgi:hypothetical protein
MLVTLAGIVKLLTAALLKAIVAIWVTGSPCMVGQRILDEKEYLSLLCAYDEWLGC